MPMKNMPLNDLCTRLAQLLDREDAIKLLRGAIGCQSITGHEANVVTFLQQEMHARHLSAICRRDFLPGRPNLSGERKGAGGGRRLLLIGHTDTVHVNGWAEHWAGTERENPFSAPIIDGKIWGRGAGDLKAGICSALAALSLLDRAGITLKGDVAFAFVGDEESGEEGSGVSAGVKAYVDEIKTGAIAKPDFVIYVEPTQLEVFTAQMGFFIADITIKGKSAYFGTPEIGKDALKAAHAVMSALWQHSQQLAAAAQHELVGTSFLLITDMRAGGFIAVPEEAHLSLIHKLLPGQSLDQAVHDMEQVIHAAITDPEIQVKITYPAGRDHPLGGTGAEIDHTLPEVSLLSTCAQMAFPGRGAIKGAPYWSECPFFIHPWGIPAVYCAPGDISNCHTFNEHVVIDEYLAGIVAFAAFMAHYCGIAEPARTGASSHP